MRIIQDFDSDYIRRADIEIACIPVSSPARPMQTFGVNHASDFLAQVAEAIRCRGMYNSLAKRIKVKRLRIRCRPLCTSMPLLHIAVS